MAAGGAVGGITPSLTLREMIAVTFEEDADSIDFEDWDEDNRTVDTIVIALGFLLLRVNGRLDAEGLAVVDIALDRQQKRYGADVPELSRARQDLASFAQ